MTEVLREGGGGKEEPSCGLGGGRGESTMRKAASGQYERGETVFLASEKIG